MLLQSSYNLRCTFAMLIKKDPFKIHILIIANVFVH